jgi:GNAT superfamily N-acetyltransferase
MLLGSGVVALCYLVAEARFAGTGRAMLGALETEARRRGMTKLRLKSSRTARAFYLRNGFLAGGPAVTSRFGLEGLPMKKSS